jgi:3-methyladenine DNA glycosylase AlkD
MDVKKMAAEIKRHLDALPNLRTPVVRVLRRFFTHKVKTATPAEMVQLALRLIDGREIVRRFMAYELLAHHKSALASLGKRDLEQLGAGLDSWGAVDTFACYLAGRAWRERQIGDRVVHGWARSPDRWWRRTALVSTVPLNNKAQGGDGDAKRTLAVCWLLLADRDDMVVKAMSWALRELAKRDAPAVRAFVEEHREQLAARVLREVGNKLRTGLKNPRR